MSSFNNLLAVGDCITLGIQDCLGNSYPEKLGARLGCPVTNRGFTMSTSREGKNLLEDSLGQQHDCVILQFGVADSHMTFRYAPYVLYYPDRSSRKFFRNIVKEYKKLAKKYGLNQRFGEARVVSEYEYRTNFLHMIERCGDRQVILPETIPHQETFRNPAIKRYNKILRELSRPHHNCTYVEVYDDLVDDMGSLYLDKGHPNGRGYDLIATNIFNALAHRTE
jgi:lysophospholipase L1-like esterase